MQEIQKELNLKSLANIKLQSEFNDLCNSIIEMDENEIRIQQKKSGYKPKREIDEFNNKKYQD